MLKFMEKKEFEMVYCYMKKQNPYVMHKVQVINAIERSVKPKGEGDIKVFHGVAYNDSVEAFSMLHGMVFAFNEDYHIFQALRKATDETICLDNYMFYLSDEGDVFLWYKCN